MSCLQNFFIILAVAYLTKAVEQEPIKNQENICKTQANGAIIENSRDIQKFYICFQQKPYEYNCPHGYYYDTKLGNCVPRANYPIAVNNKPAICKEGNIRPVADDCHKFEACVEGQYQKLKCPPSYYFNVQKLICVPFNYDAEFKCNCLMPEYTVFENENNCATYFVCHGKSAILEKCPLGQYYNIKLSTCLNDSKGICL